MNRSINRTILECKEHKGESDYQIHAVLIEPYWNVKVCNVPRTWIPVNVLIEPYWNVKQVAESTKQRIQKY